MRSLSTITHSGSHARGDCGTESITPGDSRGCGVVVWDTVLVRAVMDAVVELGLVAEAVVVAVTAAKGTGLGKHVGIACFLDDCQHHAASLGVRLMVLEPGVQMDEMAILTAQSGKLGGKPPWAAARVAPAMARKRVDFIVNFCGQAIEPRMMSSSNGYCRFGEADRRCKLWG